ncbi:MAG: hypothetical protein DCC50_09965 [Acidobacteria bacterium]|nr:MAG: hypothetical protein DCC50_09965 [Acidobacteriota bacterium]
MDGTAVLEPDVTVRGSVSDEHAAPVTVTVQGEEVEVAADGSFEVVVTLEAGAQDLTVVATDAVGNWVSATREVAWFDVGTAWDVAGGRGKVQPVKLALTDPAGDPVQVDGVELELVRDGEVEASFEMRFVDGTDYLALVQGVPRGTYDLRAVLTIEGFAAVVDGPELRVWR